jgi:hypothetical protein
MSSLYSLSHHQRGFLIRPAPMVAMDCAAEIDPLRLIEIDAEHGVRLALTSAVAVEDDRNRTGVWFRSSWLASGRGGNT